MRKAFIQRFVDTASDHYQKHIAALVQYSDGFYYDGYLWDCLRDNKEWENECRMEEAAAFLSGKKNVFVMWDLFSKERRYGCKFCSLKYPADIVINIRGDCFARLVVEEWNREQAARKAACNCEGLWLPHDIYCFDESMSWYAIFTHEGWDSWTNPELDEDDYIRVCFLNAQA